MWTKPAPQLNSLQTNCLQRCSKLQLPSSNTNLPIHMRQSILDYLVRHRIAASAQFVCNLLQGGVYSFDLWAICDFNLYKEQEVCLILDTLAANGAQLRELVIGGATWIYNRRILNGPLRALFSQPLANLRSLKIQQVSSTDEMIAICKS